MADIEATVAVACGVPQREVAIVARRLREKDLLTRETRSPRSWRSTPRDAAHIAAALMTGVGPIHAPAAVVEMASVVLQPDDVRGVRNSDIPQPLRSAIARRPHIVSAIEGMITYMASADHLLYGGLRQWSAVNYDFRENMGDVWLYWVTMEDRFSEKSVHLIYSGPARREVGLSARYTLKFEAICQIAQVFRG